MGGHFSVPINMGTQRVTHYTELVTDRASSGLGHRACVVWVVGLFFSLEHQDTQVHI